TGKVTCPIAPSGCVWANRARTVHRAESRDGTDGGTGSCLPRLRERVPVGTSRRAGIRAATRPRARPDRPAAPPLFPSRALRRETGGKPPHGPVGEAGAARRARRSGTGRGGRRRGRHGGRPVGF